MKTQAKLSLLWAVVFSLVIAHTASADSNIALVRVFKKPGIQRDIRMTEKSLNRLLEAVFSDKQKFRTIGLVEVPKSGTRH